MKLRAAILALGLSGVLAAPASAAPTTLQAGLRDASPLSAAETPDNAFVAAWNYDDGQGHISSRIYERASAFTGGHQLDVGTQLSEGPQAYASNHAVVMPVRYGRVVRGYVQQTLSLRTYDATNATLSHSTALVRDAVIRDTALATGPKGRIAAAWIETHGSTDRIVYAVRSNGKLGAPHVVSGSGHAEAVTLAYDGEGDLLIAYAKYRGTHRVIARVQPAGHGVGHETDIGPQTGQLSLKASGEPNGNRFVVAWQNADPSGAGPGFAPTVYATTRNAIGHFRLPAQKLDKGSVSEYPNGEAQALFAADGTANVAWDEPTASGEQLRAATAGIGQPFTVSDLGAQGAASDITGDPRSGTTRLLAGATSPGTQTRSGILEFTRTTPAASFGPAQTLDASGAAQDPIAAGDAVLWAAGPNGNRSIVLDTPPPAAR